MEFGEWEVDELVWEATANDGEVQKSLPVRHVHELNDAALETADEAEIDDIPGLNKLWDVRDQEGLLHVDAMSGFNILSRLSMLWTVWHR